MATRNGGGQWSGRGRAVDVFPPRGSSLKAQAAVAETPSDAAAAALHFRELVALLAQQLLRGYVLPPDAEEFTLQGQVDVAAAGQVVLPNSLVVPEGYESRVTFVQFLATVADATMGVSPFSLRVNGAAVKGYAGLEVFLSGGPQSIAFDSNILLIENQVLDAIYVGANATARRVGYNFRGYIAPKGSSEGQS